MTVVEADGNYVEPVTLGNLHVYSGETYSVLLKTYDDVPPKGQNNFWIVSRVHGRLPKTPPGLAVLAYTSAAAAAAAGSSRKPPAAALLLPITPPPPAPAAWDDTAFSVAQSRLFVARQGKLQIRTEAAASSEILNFVNLILSSVDVFQSVSQ
jgi:L-ascorbate oxidase